MKNTAATLPLALLTIIATIIVLCIVVTPVINQIWPSPTLSPASTSRTIPIWPIRPWPPTPASPYIFYTPYPSWLLTQEAEAYATNEVRVIATLTERTRKERNPNAP